MKKSLLFVFPLCALAILIGSGRAYAQGVGVGVKGGVVFPDFRAESLDLDNKTGWQIGLFVGGNRTGIVGFQAEVNWLRQESDVAIAGGGTSQLKTDYIQIPVLLRVNIGTESKNKFAIYGIAGPSFDTKVNEEVTGFTSTTTDAFETLNISLMFGGGMEISRFIVEGRYAWGLRQVNQDFNSTIDLKINSFAILFGVRFN